MDASEVLNEQLTATFDQNGWFVAIANALSNLTAAQAAWKGPGLEHSIAQILAHLNFYNERHLRRVRGEPSDPAAVDNAATFSPLASSEDAWSREVSRFTTIMSGWRHELSLAAADADGQTLDDHVASVVAHMNLHNAYHAGQIVMLRKLQRSWDPADGVS
jgi:uncharacterized damage-inducible protein DinB